MQLFSWPSIAPNPCGYIRYSYIVIFPSRKWLFAKVTLSLFTVTAVVPSSACTSCCSASPLRLMRCPAPSFVTGVLSPGQRKPPRPVGVIANNHRLHLLLQLDFNMETVSRRPLQTQKTGLTLQCFSPSPILCPRFRSLFSLRLVLFPRPFLPPAPVSANTPLHSSSAVTGKQSVSLTFIVRPMQVKNFALNEAWMMLLELLEVRRRLTFVEKAAMSSLLPSGCRKQRDGRVYLKRGERSSAQRLRDLSCSPKNTKRQCNWNRNNTFIESRSNSDGILLFGSPTKLLWATLFIYLLLAYKDIVVPQ